MLNIEDVEERIAFWNKSQTSLRILEEAVSLTQHHDGVSGTAKTVTNADYLNRLYNGTMVIESRI